MHSIVASEAVMVVLCWRLSLGNAACTHLLSASAGHLWRDSELFLLQSWTFDLLVFSIMLGQGYASCAFCRQDGLNLAL